MSAKLAWGHFKIKWMRYWCECACVYTHTKNAWNMCEFNSKVLLWFLLLKLWRVLPLEEDIENRNWVWGTTNYNTGNRKWEQRGKDPSSLLLCRYWSPLAVPKLPERRAKETEQGSLQHINDMALYQLDHIYIFHLHKQYCHIHWCLLARLSWSQYVWPQCTI